MRELIMDASTWETDEDIFRWFFRVVAAPPWHGKNFDALSDSIKGGQINEIEVPYRLVLANYDQVDLAVKPESDRFIELIRELAAGGVPVEFRVETSS